MVRSIVCVLKDFLADGLAVAGIEQASFLPGRYSTTGIDYIWDDMVWQLQRVG